MIVFLYGGFGNKLFQLTYAIAKTKKKHLKSLYFADCSLCYAYSHTDFFTEHLISYLYPDQNKFIKLQSKYMRFLLKISRIERMQSVMNKFGIYSGYFQSTKHIETILSDSRLILKIQEFFSIKSAIDENKVTIHVRGSDFLLSKNSKLNTVNKKYYSDAITYVKNQHGIENFRVISDDLEYARQLIGELVGTTCEYYSESMSNDFLELMKAEILICSNSTYCFWSAVLGKSKIAITPFKLNSTQNYPDISTNMKMQVFI